MRLMRNRGYFAAFIVSLAASFGVQACSSSPQGTAPSSDGLTGKLILTGSSTVAPLVGEIAKRFEAEHPSVRIDVQTGGSSRGLADAKQRLADIGMISRALKPEETDDFQGFVIAQDGIGVIINKANSVGAISDRQLVDIYTNQIQNWREVGGEDAPITVVNKAEGRSTLELFLSYFQLQNSQIQADVIIGDNQQGIKTVAGNANAIGYVSIGAAEYDIGQGAPIHLLPVGGVEATVETVQDGSFPLARPLTLVTANPPSGLTQEFIQFAQSEDVHDIIKAQNFVPVQRKELAQTLR
ncbi:MAG: phosphate ABC transporter substrate-binding protein [Leptolyngbyaceae cyanobacterium MO_188.B28]|nr:phosphate ABC transporter substrate-binding protein [Leptolyngbyaceae cyanobacterium MO_188.B28]